jgi:acetyl-CoA carboxylase biotin carboxyl carrier protein
MDLNLISQLIKMTEQSKLTSLEVQSGDLRIKLEKQASSKICTNLENSTSNDFKEELKSLEVKEENTAQMKESTIESDIEQNYKTIKSPIVGTFYSAAGADSEPYVNKGKKVKKGETLCIIEAMKLMNEIESDYDGEIVDILVENGDMVEYGQPLFKIN